MSVDSIPARTWLLGTLASWAVLAWVLALFGMGGRIEPLPKDASLNKPLPKMPAETTPRIGPASQYAEASTRPPFSQDRRAHAFFIEGSGTPEAAASFDLVLSSVLITPTLQMVILEPSQGGESLRVKLGEEPKGLSGWRLAEVLPRSAVFDGPEGRRTLELRVFTGSLAAPATSGTNVPPPPPAPTPAPANSATAITSEQQMQLIRQRIEARRAQMRQQQKSNPASPVLTNPAPSDR